MESLVSLRSPNAPRPFCELKPNYVPVRVELRLVCGFSGLKTGMLQTCSLHRLLGILYQPPSQLALATGQTLEPTKSYLCDNEMDYLSSPF